MSTLRQSMEEMQQQHSFVFKQFLLGNHTVKEWFKVHNKFACGEELLSLDLGKRLICNYLQPDVIPGVFLIFLVSKRH